MATVHIRKGRSVFYVRVQLSKILRNSPRSHLKFTLPFLKEG